MKVLGFILILAGTALSGAQAWWIFWSDSCKAMAICSRVSLELNNETLQLLVVLIAAYLIWQGAIFVKPDR